MPLSSSLAFFTSPTLSFACGLQFLLNAQFPVSSFRRRTCNILHQRRAHPYLSQRSIRSTSFPFDFPFGALPGRCSLPGRRSLGVVDLYASHRFGFRFTFLASLPIVGECRGIGIGITLGRKKYCSPLTISVALLIHPHKLLSHLSFLHVYRLSTTDEILLIIPPSSPAHRHSRSPCLGW